MSLDPIWGVGVYGADDFMSRRDCLPLTFAALSAALVPAGAQDSTNSVPSPAPVASQRWNFHVQNTAIVQGYPEYSAKYSGPNSLPAGGETRETVSLDLMAGLRLWPGAEAHADGLLWQGFGLGNGVGAEAFPNGEAFKFGTAAPAFMFARLFLRQTIGLGGDQEDVADSEFALAGRQDISRLTFTIGRFSAKDIFDNNTYANDPRTQFLNWGLMANEGWDYPADSVGYTTGLAVELNQEQWTLRYGFFQMPRLKNWWTADDGYIKWPNEDTAGDAEFWKSWGMVTELERRYQLASHPGALRLLAYLNEAHMANFNAATAILLANGPAADLTAAHAYRYKYGFGLNWEQEVCKNVGVFARGGWNDGQNEAWTSADPNYAVSVGVSVKGESWHRPDDTFGLGGMANGASHAQQKYLAAGGTGILDGDGRLSYGWEKGVETYYNIKIWRTLHFSLDYQFITNPSFNQDRGPISVFAARVHWEF